MLAIYRGGRWLSGRMLASPEALGCVLEQDTLYSAYPTQEDLFLHD